MNLYSVANKIEGVFMSLFQKYCDYFIYMWHKASSKKRILFFLCIYTVLFLITFCMAYSSFLLEGKSFIERTDGRDLHYPTLVYIGNYLKQIFAGFLNAELNIPLFDLNLALGSDVIGTLNFYGFGDPLTFLALLVPTEHIDYLYSFLVVLRLYLSGISFCIMCTIFNKRMVYSLVGALVYVFCGYAVSSAALHPFFLNPMIQLPLMVSGLDLVMRRKRPYLFIFSVCYSAFCGFYFLYMMTIMLGIYAIIRFFEYYSLNRIKEFMQMVFRIVGS